MNSIPEYDSRALETSDHWSRKYLGLKWVNGGRGPVDFDCWGLLWWIYEKEFGITIPRWPGVDASDLLTIRRIIRSDEAWRAVWTPSLVLVPNCGVLMGNKDMLHHVGIGLPEGRILHTSVTSGGVVAQTPQMLRCLGYSTILYFVHANCR